MDIWTVLMRPHNHVFPVDFAYLKGLAGDGYLAFANSHNDAIGRILD